mmetsp:Transcript_7133/g.10624  ORF Transcript_7133/g.10624 Transcript_7133/m.10624 type:complete len:128 (+) Transcript_7133:30-413(+)|eukprot:CAMPEP_0185017602 /NCGR_PEP_ID=MMETSP1103-20130426/539_1 /TAXON_ID=36769 /ORGANISM="Paraphysomonas bandaiensis, Strain Caron Lab Isolate" /LENGTH=127 /DNA_ID=CAMNT_0027547093 /DNA_START=30 /DNA_END=413 /DNA_ORIENTATION=+
MEGVCVPCSDMDQSSILSSEDVNEMLKDMPLWKLNSNGHLSRVFIAKNFTAAMDFLNQAAAVAESMGHHPDMHLTSYRQVEIVLYTHSVGGLTQADFMEARKLDELPVTYSPKWYRENFPSQDTGKS